MPQKDPLHFFSKWIYMWHAWVGSEIGHRQKFVEVQKNRLISPGPNAFAVRKSVLRLTFL